MRRDLRIASVVGARPNFIKLMPIHKKLSNICHHSIIHTGQRYNFELTEIFFKEFNLPQPNYDLGVGSGPSYYQVADMIMKVGKVLESNKFDMVLVYGDTNSTLSGAIAANKLNIPLGHIEAGLRSFDRRMPEETNRLLVDNISNHLFAPTNTVVKNLRTENIFGQVYYTGDLSVEIIENTLLLAN